MSEFWKRTLSGAVYVAVVVGVTVWAQDYFLYMTVMLAMLAAREFHNLMGDRRPLMMLSTLSAALLCTFLPLVVRHESAAIHAMIYFMLILIALVNELFAKQKNPIENWGHILIAQVMIGMPFATMNVIEHHNKWLMLAVFVIIWVNDSGAYCVGSLMSKRKGGNHKMFPRVSPGKSWEGLIGGLVFAMVAGYIFSIFVTEIAAWKWVMLALAIAAAGTLGDLMESIFKRTLGVKDSGKFMPGHGGVLDRFDSLLLATPVVFLILLLL